MRCPDAALAVVPESKTIATLQPEDVAAKVRKRALQAVAAHVGGRARGLDDDACEDAGAGLARAAVHRLVDAAGVTQLIEVELGRDSRCVPARQVAVLTPDFEIVDVAATHHPRVYLDWDGNGLWDRLEYGSAGADSTFDRARSSARVVTLDGAHQVLAGFPAEATLRLQTPVDEP